MGQEFWGILRLFCCCFSFFTFSECPKIFCHGPPATSTHLMVFDTDILIWNSKLSSLELLFWVRTSWAQRAVRAVPDGDARSVMQDAYAHLGVAFRTHAAIGSFDNHSSISRPASRTTHPAPPRRSLRRRASSKTPRSSLSEVGRDPHPASRAKAGITHPASRTSHPETRNSHPGSRAGHPASGIG